MDLLFCWLMHLPFLMTCVGCVSSKSHFVNVALYKNTTSSDMNHEHFSSGQGVDGDLVWRTVSHPNNGSGVHTVSEDQAWWRVDLGQENIIRHLKLYNRNDSVRNQNRIKGFRIFVTSSTDPGVLVDDNLCYKDTDSRSKPEYDISCERQMRGTYVTIKLTTKNFLNFRELEVYDGSACEEGWYGEDCSKNCSDRHCANKLSTCEMDGSCDGNNCSINTTHSSDEAVCLVCEDGWFGGDCSSKCNANCTQCMGTRGQCISCMEGRYNVENQCSDQCRDRKCCDDKGKCPADGHCSARGCLVGFYLGNCSMPCPQPNCFRCNQSTGLCLGCSDGFFTDKCNQSCHENCAGACGFIDGVCFTCKNGYFGSRCQEACSNTCADTTCGKIGKCNSNEVLCDRKNGVCLNGCLPGYYGKKCQSKCNFACKGIAGGSPTCDQLTGRCSDGCIQGYFGDKCQSTCSITCKPTTSGERSCDQSTGRCINYCADGYYGVNCTSRCSPHCFLRRCQRETGNCLNGCIYGVGGLKCDSRSLTDSGGSANGISVTTFVIVVAAQSVLFVAILIAVIAHRRVRKRPQREERNADQSIGEENATSSFTYCNLKESSSSESNLIENSVYYS